MTTRTTARPTTGAGPHPEDHTMPKYATHDRILDAINAGRISRDPATYEYVDSNGRLREIDLTLYEMADRGWLTLHLDGRIEVTDAGRAWQDRPRKPAPVPAAQFSDAGAAA
ncbi:hypothetical protein ACH4T9_12410 [Micromonospora sp. NPDC020750]|uniref:hypothetical protein n=1 Tax=unclassified Micromonospora TaxID=2617518 RepID=UPI0037A58F51